MSSEPFQTYTAEQQAAMQRAEEAASAAWQKWHDAKAALQADASDAERAEVERLRDESERLQEEVKKDQPMC